MSQRALREAYVAGAAAYNAAIGRERGPYFNDRWMPEAMAVYPPKTVEQPRTVEVVFKGLDVKAEYRFVDGEFQMRSCGSWSPAGSVWVVEEGALAFEANCFEPHSVIALMELYENPTETVEVDD